APAGAILSGSPARTHHDPAIPPDLDALAPGCCPAVLGALAAFGGRRWRDAAHGLVLLAIIGTTVLAMLSEAPPLQALRHAVFDQYQRWHPRTYQDTAVRIIDVDEESLRRFGQWPWPRTRLAELVDRFK